VALPDPADPPTNPPWMHKIQERNRRLVRLPDSISMAPPNVYHQRIGAVYPHPKYHAPNGGMTFPRNNARIPQTHAHNHIENLILFANNADHKRFEGEEKRIFGMVTDTASRH